MLNQREQEKCAHRRATAVKLRDIATEIRASRNLVEAAFMAAHNLEQSVRDPLVELLATISDRLKGEADAISAQADASTQEGTTDAA